MMEFDPTDDEHWIAGSHLNWWESHISRPLDWMPDEREAHDWLTRHPYELLHAVGLLNSYRTMTTSQLHAFDPRLPANPAGRLWLDLAACRLVDLGWPIHADGSSRANNRTARFTALRLPSVHAIERDMRRFDLYTPVELASIGPHPWKGVRQYDRHNLIAVAIAINARRQGWRTSGENWGRFRYLTHDQTCLKPDGGPDVQLIGEHDLICVELTNSLTQDIGKKIHDWSLTLARDDMRHCHVVWASAGRGPNAGYMLNALRRDTAGFARQHVIQAADWVHDAIRIGDWTPKPGRPQDAAGWMYRDIADIGRVLGFEDADRWRLPPRLEGLWLG